MRIRDKLARIAHQRSGDGSAVTATGHLGDVNAFGSNPGALSARSYSPADLAPGSALVVVLHGCTQTAAGYDRGAGWSKLADRAGFAVLFPEQRRENNANLCFNWFEAADIVRRGGEAESIAQMVEAMTERHALDPARVFVTGLSAGGAMTAVMLATYPDLFAGGAIIGGLPYRCAEGVGAALQRMAGRGHIDRSQAIRAAERASGTTPRRWPTVSIWHGSADTTVAPANMDLLAAQWCGVHGIDEGSVVAERGANWARQRWEAGGRTVVETWRISGMGHGVPIDPSGAEGIGAVGPFMLPVGIDSTAEIARGWGLMPTRERVAGRPVTARAVSKHVPVTAARPSVVPPPLAARPAFNIQAVIEDALRSAGLMR